ncbi:hypothetical protein Agub_g10733, partial [Astrephomene gubernaculifera]
ATATTPAATPWYEVEAVCSEGKGPVGRGIYLREPHESAKPQSYRVTVTPKLPEHAANSDRLGVEERLLLESSVPWVTCPPALLLHHAPRSFEVLIDPTRLSPGLHTGEVVALQLSARSRGPLFRLPVTLVKPLQLLPGPGLQGADAGAAHAAVAVASGYSSSDSGKDGNGSGGNGNGKGAAVGGMVSLGPLSLAPGAEFRSFLAVPPGASWAELTLRSAPYDNPKLLLLRATQLRPAASYRQHEMRTQVTLSGGSEYLTSFPVVGGGTLELTLALFWSAQGTAHLQQLEICFHGVTVAAEGGAAGAGGSGGGTELALQGAELAKKIMVSLPPWAAPTRVRPEARLTQLHIPLRPAEAVLEPATGERDALPEGRVVYRLLLSYRTSLSEPGKYRPCMPLLEKQLYESPLESQLLQLYDASSQQLLATMDAADPQTVTLPPQGRKGPLELLIRLSLRADEGEVLERLRGLPLLLIRSLEAGGGGGGGGLVVPVYGSRRDAILAATTTTAGGGGGGGGGSGGGNSDYDTDGVCAFSSADEATGDTGAAAGAAAAAAAAGSPVGEMLLRAGEVVPLFVGPMAEEKLPKDATQGRLLVGQLTLGQLRRGGGAAPHRLALSYLVPPPPAAAAGNGGGGGASKDGDADKDKAPEIKLAEAVRDAQMRVLRDLKLSDPAQAALYDKLYGELRSSYPAHLPLLVEHLRKLDGRESSSRRTPAGLAAVVAAAEVVVRQVDSGALAASLGVRAGGEEGAEARRARRAAEEQRGALVEALGRQAAALLDAEEEETKKREEMEKEGEKAKGQEAEKEVQLGSEGDVATGAAEDGGVKGAAEDGGVAAAEKEDGGVAAAEKEDGGVAAAEKEDGGVAAAEKEDGGVAAAEKEDGGVAAAEKEDGGVAAAEKEDGGVAAAEKEDGVTACMRELRKWVDTASDPAHLLLHARVEARARRYATALRALDRLLASDDKSVATGAGRREVSELRCRLFAALGWSHIEAQERELQAIRFPKSLALL